jgi:hypothetical protein
LMPILHRRHRHSKAKTHSHVPCTFRSITGSMRNDTSRARVRMKVRRPAFINKGPQTRA